MQSLRFLFWLGVCLLLYSCSASNPHDQLHALFDEEWNFRLAEDPLFATSAGYHQYDDRLPQVTIADEGRRAQFYRGLLGKLEKIERAQLRHDDRINFDIFKMQLQDNLDDFEYKTYLIPFTVDAGFHIGFARLPNQMPFTTAQDYENYIKRLQAFPDYVAQHIDLLKEGLKTGMTMPQ
ncbi:MAG: DUF885 family protein, partial [bacterium]